MITAAVMHQAPSLAAQRSNFFCAHSGRMGSWDSGLHSMGSPLRSRFGQTASQTISSATCSPGQKWKTYTSVAVSGGENLGPAQRGLSEAVTAIPGVWVDLDFGDGHKKKNLPPTQDTALELLRELGPRRPY